MSAPSKRGQQWQDFSNNVFEHVEDYTVPQYGDAPNDQVANWDEGQIITQIEKYVGRLRTNARGPEEAARDLLKIAHYSCLLDALRRDGNGHAAIYKD